MTLYIAAYDTESPSCLAACRKIVEVHRRFDMPATFFLVGKILMADPDDYRELLDDPLFEIASHTYSHKMLRTILSVDQQHRNSKSKRKSSVARALLSVSSADRVWESDLPAASQTA